MLVLGRLMKVRREGGLLHLGGVGDGHELCVAGASDGGSVDELALMGWGWGEGVSVRSVCGTDDGAVEVDVEGDFVALGVYEVG